MGDPPPVTTAFGQVEAFKLGIDDWEQYTERLDRSVGFHRLRANLEERFPHTNVGEVPYQ